MKITVVESSSDFVRLRMEDRLTGRWVEEFKEYLRAARSQRWIRLTLNMAEVSSVDAAGIELLKELRIRLVTLLNHSSSVAEQLEAQGEEIVIQNLPSGYSE